MNTRLMKKIEKSDQKIVHLLFIGTKPDIIKQAPIYHELRNRGELVVVCHTGQHYDYNNSRAILKELNFEVDINFKIKGELQDKLSQIITKTID